MSAELQRLGETPEYGRQLLRLLECSGWTIDVRPAFAGDGTMVTASKNGHEVRRNGGAVAEVACEVFEEAVRVQRLGIQAGEQLRLL